MPIVIYLMAEISASAGNINPPKLTEKITITFDQDD